MEQNTDRMGFALIALSIVAVVLIIMNTIFGPTVKSYFQGLQKWSDNVMNQLNPPQQYTHTAYSWSADGKTNFFTSMPNFNLLSGTKDFSNSGSIVWRNLDVWTKSGSYDNIAIYSNTGIWHGINANYIIPESGTYTFSVFAEKKASNRSHLKIDKVVFASDGSSSIVNVKDVIYDTPFDLKRLSLSLDLNKNDTVFGYFTNESTGSISVGGYKLEKGSVATPYMPSQSEAIPADGPTYIGTYTDTNEQGSQDPSKYTWIKTN